MRCVRSEMDQSRSFPYGASQSGRCREGCAIGGIIVTAREMATFARSPNGGLVVTGSARTVLHRDLIIALAAQHRLPAVYYEHYYVVAGGLISYGPNNVDEFRRAASYVDRILKGEKPADLPVQADTK